MRRPFADTAFKLGRHKNADAGTTSGIDEAQLFCPGDGRNGQVHALKGKCQAIVVTVVDDVQLDIELAELGPCLWLH